MSAWSAAGGVSIGAIHRAAGPELPQRVLVPEVVPACCPTGEAHVTPGFRLPARFGDSHGRPVWHGRQPQRAGSLASCYRNVLAACAPHGFAAWRSPAISCGVYGFPCVQAAEIAVREIAAALAGSSPLDTITLVAFEDDVAEVLYAILSTPAAPHRSQRPRHAEKRSTRRIAAPPTRGDSRRI